jgi:hypothetical protein
LALAFIVVASDVALPESLHRGAHSRSRALRGGEGAPVVAILVVHTSDVVHEEAIQDLNLLYQDYTCASGSISEIHAAIVHTYSLWMSCRWIKSVRAIFVYCSFPNS